jgi:hypothetical protein
MLSKELSMSVASMLDHIAPIEILCGHYGVGKTNLSLNLVHDMCAAGRSVTLIDVDTVNPYFRSSDYQSLVHSWGAQIIIPEFAGTSLDTPSLSGRIEAELDEMRNDPDRIILIDVGGDEVGATVLGRFAPQISRITYGFDYVVNAFRDDQCDLDTAESLAHLIEHAAHLSLTGVVDNAHLMQDTTVDTVLSGYPFARDVAKRLDLPLRAVTAPAALSQDVASVNFQTVARDSIYFVQRYVKVPWEHSFQSR